MKDTKEPEAAPYGTRSRNRPGRSRINYAEDVEMDFEMAQGTPASANASGPSSRGSVAAESAHSTAAGAKKGPGSGQGNALWGSTVANPKDQPPNPNIPGTSTFAANPNSNSAQPPKRRKNAASHATNGANATPAAPSHAGGRRAANNASNASNANNAVVAPNGARESNMMTFERTGARLVHGRLEADNGETVSINGECFS
jgi:hypothetical protein